MRVLCGGVSGVFGVRVCVCMQQEAMEVYLRMSKLTSDEIRCRRVCVCVCLYMCVCVCACVRVCVYYAVAVT